MVDLPPEIYQMVTVTRGARSVRSLTYFETFHPVVGPMVEARGLHAAQQRLVQRAHETVAGPFSVWDVGLGAAANAIAVLEAFRDGGPVERSVEIHSFDRTREALRFAFQNADDLGYFGEWKSSVEELLETGVTTWQGITWRFHFGDFRETVLDSTITPPQAVLFDPYSPTTNPELWNVETFAAIRRRISEIPSLLTTYSRATSVRVSLLMAGWFVGKGGATGEKPETTLAASDLSLLEEPLDARWVERVSRSSVPGPLTATAGPLLSAQEVAEILAQHPQFLGGRG